jgi:hypothetical protein
MGGSVPTQLRNQLEGYTSTRMMCNRMRLDRE